MDPQSYDIDSIMKSPNIPIGEGASSFIAANSAADILRHISSKDNSSCKQSLHLNPNDDEVRASNDVADDGEFVMMVEDDTETRWSEENGGSLMDYLLSSGNGRSDSFDDFENGFDDSMADFDWSFATTDPTSPS